MLSDIRQWFRCEVLNRHTAADGILFDGGKLLSYCRHCGIDVVVLVGKISSTRGRHVI